MPTPPAHPDFARLLTAHQPQLYALVHATVTDPQLAHDIFQETNRVLWEKAEEFDGARPFLPWAFTIARLQIRAAWTRQGRERLAFDSDVAERVADRLESRSAGLGPRQVALAECLQRVSDDDRALLNRRYALGESVESIARSLRRTSNAVAVALHRLRSGLADCIRARLATGAES